MTGPPVVLLTNQPRKPGDQGAQQSAGKHPLKSSKTLTSAASFVVVDSTLNGKKWHFKGGLVGSTFKIGSWQFFLDKIQVLM